MIMLRALLVASLSVASANHNKAALRPALKLRGGLAGVDASTAATVGAWLGTVNGVYCGIAEGPACEAYGVDNPSFNMLQIVNLPSSHPHPHLHPHPCPHPHPHPPSRSPSFATRRSRTLATPSLRRVSSPCAS